VVFGRPAELERTRVVDETHTAGIVLAAFAPFAMTSPRLDSGGVGHSANPHLPPGRSDGTGEFPSFPARRRSVVQRLVKIRTPGGVINAAE